MSRGDPLTRRIRAGVALALLVRHCPSLMMFFALPAALGLAGDAVGLTLRVLPALVAVGGFWATRRWLPVPDDLRTHEALSATALIFVIGAAGMCWPLTYYGMTPLDAFFEAMSGLTSTGFTMVRDIEAWPWPALVTRAWTQWYGGFVILTVVVALIVHPGTTARRLGLLSVKSDDMVQMMRERARRVLIAYTAITGLCIAAFLATLGDPLAAVTLAFATVSTGGFSIYNDSVSGLPVPGLLAIAAFCLLGACPLDRSARLLRGQPGAFFDDVQVRTLLTVTTAGIAILIALQWIETRTLSVADAGRLAFLGISAQTTTGFAMPGDIRLGPAQGLVAMLMMAVGGTLGSTAGGIKILRFLVLGSVVRQNLRETTVGPHALTTPRLASARVHDDEVDHALSIVVLFVTVHLISLVVLVACGLPVFDAAFDIVSAVSTVGLSSGVLGPDLAPLPKLVLIINMWVGRLEVLAVIVFLTPRYWMKRR